MEITMRPVESLKPYDKNPRKNAGAVDAVAASIKEFGFKVPCVITRNGVIVTGHTRKLAAEKLGLKEVPCIIADDLTDNQIKAFRLADNKSGEMAMWDYTLMLEELQGIENIDMGQFGFEETDFASLDEFLTDEASKQKKPKQVQCPHCGMWFE